MQSAKSIASEFKDSKIPKCGIFCGQLLDENLLNHEEKANVKIITSEIEIDDISRYRIKTKFDQMDEMTQVDDPLTNPQTQNNKIVPTSPLKQNQISNGITKSNQDEILHPMNQTKLPNGDNQPVFIEIDLKQAQNLNNTTAINNTTIRTGTSPSKPPVSLLGNGTNSSSQKSIGTKQNLEESLKQTRLNLGRIKQAIDQVLTKNVKHGLCVINQKQMPHNSPHKRGQAYDSLKYAVEHLKKQHSVDNILTLEFDLNAYPAEDIKMETYDPSVVQISLNRLKFKQDWEELRKLPAQNQFYFPLRQQDDSALPGVLGNNSILNNSDDLEDQQYLFLLKRFLRPIWESRKPEFVIVQCDTNRLDLSMECLASFFKHLKKVTKNLVVLLEGDNDKETFAKKFFLVLDAIITKNEFLKCRYQLGSEDDIELFYRFYEAYRDRCPGLTAKEHMKLDTKLQNEQKQRNGLTVDFFDKYFIFSSFISKAVSLEEFQFYESFNYDERLSPFLLDYLDGYQQQTQDRLNLIKFRNPFADFKIPNITLIKLGKITFPTNLKDSVVLEKLRKAAQTTQVDFQFRINSQLIRDEKMQVVSQVTREDRSKVNRSNLNEYLEQMLWDFQLNRFDHQACDAFLRFIQDFARFYESWDQILTGISILVITDARTSRYQFRIVDFNYYQPLQDNSYKVNILSSLESLSEQLRQVKRDASKAKYEQILKQVNPRGFYQKRAVFIFSVLWMLTSFILLCSPFLFISPTYDCEAYELRFGLTEKLSKEDCRTKICDLAESERLNYIYFGVDRNDNHETFTEQTELFCEKETQLTVLKSMPYLGSFFGFLLFPSLSDNYGRRFSHTLAISLCAVGCIMMASASGDGIYVTMLIGFFLAGLGSNPATSLHFAYLKELTLGSFRENASTLIQIFFGVGVCLFVMLAKLIINWRNLVLYCFMIPSILLLITPFILYETPKFVYNKNRRQAIKLFKSIAKINQKPTRNLQEIEILFYEDKRKSLSVGDLFRHKSLRLQTFCCCILYVSIIFNYYGISFTMNSVGLDLYSNLGIVGVAEFLAYTVANLFISKIPRKKLLFFGLLLAAVLSISFIFMKRDEEECPDICGIVILQIVFASINKFVICTVILVSLIYFSELFPSIITTIAIGFVCNSGTIGSFSCPYLIQDLVKKDIPPMLILGIISAIGAMSMLFLPETLGRPMMYDIKEIQEEQLKDHFQQSKLGVGVQPDSANNQSGKQTYQHLEQKY